MQCPPWDIMVKVEMDEFGHTGHLITQVAFSSEEVDIVIDDVFNWPQWLVFMLQYKSTHSKLHSTVNSENKKICHGKTISVFQDCNPANIKWGCFGAMYVVEFTGVFTIMEKFGAHW